MGEKQFPAVSHFRARKRHDNKPTTSQRNKKIQKVPSQHSQKIQKVPSLLRKEERNHDAYDPKVVSFGPYHHGEPELQLCEQGKHFAVEIFIKGSNQNREFFFGKILEIIADARNCYIAGSTDKYTDAEFAEMMLLDACFLIYYMGIGVLEPADHLSMYSHLGGLILSWVNRDVLLMENQIPFGILQLPTWLVSGVSKVFLLNMIAYELCPNNLVDAMVITNVNFIRTLVDSPDDVKELREKKILLTSLTDVQVVSLFKDLHTYGMADTESFREVQQRVQEHYDSKAKTWMAELIHTYLSSPWSIIAWFAGLLVCCFLS